MTASKALFLATAAVTTLFIITILAMVAMLAEDARSPANQWFNRNGAAVLIVQVVAIGLLGMAAMIADRRETIRKANQQKNDPNL